MTSDPSKRRSRELILIVAAVLLFCLKWLQYGLDLNVIQTFAVGLAATVILLALLRVVVRAINRAGRSGRPSRRRRWLQFSLLTLMLVVTVFCIWLGSVVKQASDRRNAIRMIQRRYGSITYEHEVDSEWSVKLNPQPPGPAWLRKWLGDVGDEYFFRVASVSLGGGRAVQLLEALDAFPEIRGLSLSGQGFSDAESVSLRKLLPQLQSLSLHLVDGADGGLQYVAGLTRLNRLIVSGEGVSDGSLEHVRGLVHLRTLVLNRTGITDDGLRHLSSLTGLTTLRIERSNVTGSGFELRDLKNLTLLDLHDSTITDAGLKRLENLPGLRILVLSNTHVTDEGVKTLQQALPNCRIIR